MRGEQDISTLANNVIQQLCRYIEIPIGALYVAINQETLRMEGAFCLSAEARHSRTALG